MRPSERSFARRIDLTSLQLFVAVCELGSIGRAAEREFIAASAVSKRLSDLEATLETPLLYRHTRGVKLTPSAYSESSACIFSRLNSTERAWCSRLSPAGVSFTPRVWR